MEYDRKERKGRKGFEFSCAACKLMSRVSCLVLEGRLTKVLASSSLVLRRSSVVGGRFVGTVVAFTLATVRMAVYNSCELCSSWRAPCLAHSSDAKGMYESRC